MMQPKQKMYSGKNNLTYCFFSSGGKMSVKPPYILLGLKNRRLEGSASLARCPRGEGRFLFISNDISGGAELLPGTELGFLSETSDAA